MTFKAWAIKRKDGTLRRALNSKIRVLYFTSKTYAKSQCHRGEIPTPVRVTVTVEEVDRG